MPDLPSEAGVPAAPTDSPTDAQGEEMIVVPFRENPHFVREQRVNRHGRYVRWFHEKTGSASRIKVIATADGVTVSGSLKCADRECARDMAAVLELAAWANGQMARGVDVMQLKF